MTEGVTEGVAERVTEGVTERVTLGKTGLLRNVAPKKVLHLLVKPHFISLSVFGSLQSIKCKIFDFLEICLNACIFNLWYLY